MSSPEDVRINDDYEDTQGAMSAGYDEVSQRHLTVTSVNVKLPQAAACVARLLTPHNVSVCVKQVLTNKNKAVTISLSDVRNTVLL